MILKRKPFYRCLLFCAVLGLTACDTPQAIVSGLQESDANEVLVVLESKKIDAEKLAIPGRVITYSVNVKTSEAKEALRILVENKLPRQVSAGLAQVYPVGGGGLIPTASEEKAKKLMAIQGEIENMLKILPGIVQASAVVVLPDTEAIRDLSTPPPKATASVAIVYNPIDHKGTASVTPEDVKYLVASAVEDLSPDGVTVVMATNAPMRLIDIKSNPHKKLSTAPAPVHKHEGAPPQLKAASIKEKKELLETQKELEKSHMLLWLFGVLALIGLALGVFGLIRSLSLKSKLAKELPAKAVTPAKEENEAP